MSAHNNTSAGHNIELKDNKGYCREARGCERVPGISGNVVRLSARSLKGSSGRVLMNNSGKRFDSVASAVVNKARPWRLPGSSFKDNTRRGSSGLLSDFTYAARSRS